MPKIKIRQDVDDIGPSSKRVKVGPTLIRTMKGRSRIIDTEDLGESVGRGFADLAIIAHSEMADILSLTDKRKMTRLESYFAVSHLI